MKKTIWLLVIVFVMAGGMYTYIFFAGQKETRANVPASCFSEMTTTEIQSCAIQSSCAALCIEANPTSPSNPSFTPPVVAKPLTETVVNEKPFNGTCENCVCGTGEECPNEEKCDECLEEKKVEKKKSTQSYPGSGQNGKNRNGQKNRK